MVISLQQQLRELKSQVLKVTLFQKISLLKFFPLLILFVSTYFDRGYNLSVGWGWIQVFWCLSNWSQYWGVFSNMLGIVENHFSVRWPLTSSLSESLILSSLKNSSSLREVIPPPYAWYLVHRDSNVSSYWMWTTWLVQIHGRNWILYDVKLILWITLTGP